MFHHDSQKFDNNFGARTQKNLTFVSLFSIAEGFEGICQNTDSYHFEQWKSKKSKNTELEDDVTQTIPTKANCLQQASQTKKGYFIMIL